ncbi:MAG: tRNA lysidine(34) synthetase TilS [Proteobacteria bacterium]|nr:MAG: tRNA lysidine(34) synthetase TilS [Pseudomonadota bacterium]
MRSGLAEGVLGAIRGQGLVRPGDRLGVAVSGGGDSVALLLLILELRNELGIVPSVVHVNHKLRGRASEADEKFVVALAEKHRLDVHLHRTDVAAAAKHSKRNLEDAARRARYGYFSTLLTSGTLTAVATAHTADDQAETVLAHLLRGTGIAGLGGIYPVMDGVVRPLLAVRREELRSYLSEHKERWREDASNRDTTRTRARIRRKLIPLMEKEFQPAAVEHLVGIAERARELEAFLKAAAEQVARVSVARSEDGLRIGVEDLLEPWKRGPAEAMDALSGRVVMDLAAEVQSKRGQLTAAHVRSVLQLARHGENGKCLQLPRGLEVRRERNRLLFARSTSRRGESPRKFEHHINLAADRPVVAVPQLHCAFRFRVIDWPPERRDTVRSGAVLDRDRLQYPLVLRNWRPGDRLHPMGRQRSHKLRRLLGEARVSTWERDGWPVLTSGGVLAWARGFPVAAEFAVTERTQAAMVIVEDPIR